MNSVTDRLWDTLIVGTGIGGATLGYALAKEGQKVLFCEKGPETIHSMKSVRGRFAPTERLAVSGRWTEWWEDRSSPRAKRFRPLLGVGSGGSSALYGMVFEKPRPHDYSSWPISEEELAPFFEEAKKLYRVRSGEERDSTEPLTPSSGEVFEFFRKKGLHPYRLALACEELPGCSHCQGYLCDRRCKNDASRICLEPALHQHGATVLNDCEVLRLEADATTVQAALCLHQGREIRIRARKIILAAGALQTPRILLNSANVFWPQGLANSSGQVGHNLMRHYVDLYLVFTRTAPRSEGASKEFGLESLHFWNGKPAGVLQSFGTLPPASQVLSDIQDSLRENRGRSASFLFGILSRLLKPLLELLFSRTLVLASILEDLPFPENRVISPATPGGLPSIAYEVKPTERSRIETIRERIRKALKPYRFVHLKEAEANHHLAHACGTCRFGNDPTRSVLDRDNRAHGLTNLYVVDSSFFPSSTGVNPSWTIAANALRVARSILKQEKGEVS